MDLGKKLMELRKEKGLSQEQVALELGVSRQTVSKWELNSSTPDFDKIIPICKLYNINSNELLNYEINDKKDETFNKEDESKETIQKENKIKNPFIFIFSIFLYFIAVIQIIITESFLKEEIAVSIFLLICGVATCLIIYFGMINSKKINIQMANNEKPRTDKNELFWLLITCIYLIISFSTFAWSISWIIFVLGGFIETFIFKNNSNNKKNTNIVIISLIIIIIIIVFINSLKWIFNTNLKYTKQYDINIKSEDEFNNNEISKINIESVSSDIEFLKHNEDYIKVVVSSNSKDNNINIYEENKVLNIIEPTNNYFMFCIFCFNDYNNIKIYIPADDFDEIIISSVSGDIYSLINFNKLTINSVSGDVSLNNINTAFVKTTSGDINIKEITEYLNASSISGDIDITKLDLVSDGNIKTTSGDVDIHNIDDINITTSTISGDVTGINNIKNYEKRLNISTISGDITIK